MLKIITSRRFCSQFVKEAKRTLRRPEVSPIALQYLYGDVPKVQTELKPPEEIEISGVVPIQRDQPVYPFALYDTLEEAKETKDETPRERRGRGRRISNEQNDQKVQDEHDELFRYGSSDAKFPSSKIPCSGCGAHLHCQDSKMPGFVPLEIFSKSIKVPRN